MAHVTILGAGNMGPAIASIVTKGGNTVEVLTRADADKPVTGDVVVLALPYPAVAEVLAQRGDQLAGKVVVDITNPLNFETFDSLVVPADSSAAAEVAAALPQSRVLKAFNTTFAGTLAAGAVGPLPTTVSSRGTTPTPRRCWPASSPPEGCAPSTPDPCAGPASSRPSAPCSSPSRPARRSLGPAASRRLSPPLPRRTTRQETPA